MTDLNYSNNLAELLSQHPDKLKVKYGPDRKLKEREDKLYYRVYTDTINPTPPPPPEISQPLSKPLYTREMKTAIMKRWLEINSQVNPLEPKFNIGVYLSKAEQYSTLFHLMELGDKNAEKYYSLVNYDISNNKDLFLWLHGEFKSKTSLLVRRRYLSFKYLAEKLARNFTTPEEGDLIGLAEELLKKARKTIVYQEKRNLVENNLDAFRKFTHDPRHLEYVKDLDYFFLVFESFFSVETAGVEEEEEEGGEHLSEEEKAKLLAELKKSNADRQKRLASRKANLEKLKQAKQIAEEASRLAAEGAEAEAGEAGAEAGEAGAVSREAEEAAREARAAREAAEAEARAAREAAAKEAAKIENEAKKLSELYSFAINFTSEEIQQYLTDELYVYDAYFLYKKMSELSKGDDKGNEHKALARYLNQIPEEEINAEKETKKGEFDGLGDEEKKQIIFGFIRANLANLEGYTNNVKQVYGANIIEIAKTNPEDWFNFYLQASYFIDIMRKVQELLKTQKITGLYKQAEAIMKQTRTIPVNPIFEDSKFLPGPYNSVYGVFVVDAQYGAKCGLHAINNLLQIKKLSCLATADTRELPRVLRGDRASDGNNLQSQQIVNIINGEVNDGIKKQHPEFLESKYFAKFITTNVIVVYDQLKGKKIGNKIFLGIIEKQVGHYVAWLLKNVDGKDIWLEIDSFGRITPYSYDDGLIILKSRPKNLVGEQAFQTYEHIAVYEEENARTSDRNGSDISGCFVNVDITNINDKTPELVQTGRGMGRITKNKSKRRYTSKKRTGKKSKKIRY